MLASVAAVLVLIVAGWAIDSMLSEGEVIRGTMLGNTPIGGLDAAGLDEVLAQLDNELTMTSLQVTVGDEPVNTDPGKLGALLDRDLLREQAMDARRDNFVLLQPFTWLATFVTDEQIDLAYTVHQATATEAIDTTLGSLVSPPREPGLRLTGDSVNIAPGQEGAELSVDEIVAELPAVLDADPPHVLELTAHPASPLTSDADVQAVADEITEATVGGAQIRVLDDVVDLEPAEIRAWIQLDTSGDTATWAIDQEQALTELRELFPRLGAEDQLARFEVVDGEPVIIPASETIICCATDSIATIRDSLLAPAPPSAEGETSGEGETDEGEEGPAPKVAVLEPEVVSADEGVAELEALGIIEEVSSFTTNHDCCQPRVTNIHRFADIVRGAIILPGEDLSLNAHVGRRTIENGFVADGAIANGVLEPQVGGGVSQFATTFFNASFFAGLDFNEYQSHSLYISRYPRGREATISWPKPDLSVKNTTDYGILVWTSYTDTSITVTMYSTQHIEVAALDLLQSSNNQCSIFTTPRVRTYPDGTVVEDSVFAQYRPGEGFNCAGESTLPPEGPTVADGDPTTLPTGDADATVVPPLGSDTPLVPIPALPDDPATPPADQ